jgi:hypothetical protein
MVFYGMRKDPFPRDGGRIPRPPDRGRRLLFFCGSFRDKKTGSKLFDPGISLFYPRNPLASLALSRRDPSLFRQVF